MFVGGNDVITDNCVIIVANTIPTPPLQYRDRGLGHK